MLFRSAYQKAVDHRRIVHLARAIFPYLLNHWVGIFGTNSGSWNWSFMKNIEIAGLSPQALKKIRCLEKESNVQQNRQAGEVEQFASCSPDAAAETVSSPETDTSPIKTITRLQSDHL